MARLYSDEQFPRRVSELLRTMGHDVLTVQEAGNANLGIPDEEKDEGVNNLIVISSTNNKAVDNVIEKLDKWLADKSLKHDFICLSDENRSSSYGSTGTSSS